MTEIDYILQKTVDEHNSPSIQYILFDKNNIIKEYSYGLANISGGKIVSNKTTYNAYSVTKTFTAVAILQLAEQGKLDIEQSVKKYLPDFPYPEDITIRQVLSHAAGIPNPIPLSWIHLAHEHAEFDREQFFRAVFLKHRKTRSTPNQQFHYSNLGYVLLGWLIEQVTGLEYEEYIRENIINRLGLQSEELDFVIPDMDLHAKGYHKNWSITNLVLGFLIDKRKYMGNVEGRWKPFNNFYVNGISYGGLIGRPSAFVKYIQELLKTNNGLIADEFMKMMFSENYTLDNKASGMCLAWFTGQLNGIKYYTHAGGGGGYYCEIRIYPGEGIGSVCFFNRTGMTDERFLDKVDKYYFERIKA